jgi:hypothetical protein
MLDLMYLAVIAAFFAATFGLIWLCDALQGGQ